MKRRTHEVYGFGAGQRTRRDWPATLARVVIAALVVGFLLSQVVAW